MNIKDYPEIFEPFDKLVEIEICGSKYLVPENNSLLRCFQYLSIETISYGDFCWNGECLNCLVQVAGDINERTVIACRTKVEENMRITGLHQEIEL